MRAQANKLYRTFVGGLITEASPLTYPENASIDEDNCVINRKGERTRRLGAEYEDAYALSTFTLAQTETEAAIQEYSWNNVANQADINFLVLQVGETVHFYDMGLANISANKKAFTIDLNDFAIAEAGDLSEMQCSFSAGKGYLFVAGKYIEPFTVEYDPDADTIATEQITILIRDLDGLDDGLANDDEPSTLSNEHHYNLKNQGWVNSAKTGSGVQIRSWNAFNEFVVSYEQASGPIQDYFNKFSRYPGNNKQWFVGKLSVDDDTKGLKAGDFDPELLEKVYFGNTRAPRGHYIVNAFYKDRAAVSGISGIAVDKKPYRPQGVAFYAGRGWYAGGSDVYYSQVIESRRQAGFCYQEADPTSEDISDLIDSDGGVVPIPEAHNIMRLVSSGNGVLVFAQNGVWYISGTASGFTARDISVSKVSPFGLEAPNSIVEAESQVYWWSKTGIQGMTQQMGLFGPVDGQFQKSNVTEATIQSFFNDTIPASAKPYVKGIYDPATNTIQWLFKTSSVTPRWCYDRVLNFDVTLGAFYPWTVSDDPSAAGPYIAGLFLTPNFNRVDGSEDVYVGSEPVIANASDQVTTTVASLTLRDQLTKYVVVVPDGSFYKFTFGLFSNSECADWETYSGSTGYAYESFVETGYELLEDAMRSKQATYIFCYFKRTEQNYEASGSDYTIDFPSSCKFRVKWDWTDSAIASRWSREIEAYRHGRLPAFSTSDLAFESGYPVVITKNKVRGSGKAIQFRFSNNQIGSSFHLLGWAVNYTGQTNV